MLFIAVAFSIHTSIMSGWSPSGKYDSNNSPLADMKLLTQVKFLPSPDNSSILFTELKILQQLRDLWPVGVRKPEHLEDQIHVGLPQLVLRIHRDGLFVLLLIVGGDGGLEEELLDGPAVGGVPGLVPVWVVRPLGQRHHGGDVEAVLAVRVRHRAGQVAEQNRRDMLYTFFYADI